LKGKLEIEIKMDEALTFTASFTNTFLKNAHTDFSFFGSLGMESIEGFSKVRRGKSGVQGLTVLHAIVSII
jgi:hypothetical protein